MKRIRNLGSLCLLVALVGCFPAFAGGVTFERAADLVAADLRYWAPGLASVAVFVERSEPIPGGHRILLRGRSLETSRDAGVVAVYEVGADDGRIWRRELVSPVARRAGTRSAVRGGVSVHGVLRNLPGYILNTPDFLSRFKIWAEAGGRVVATETELLGTTVYELKGIPVTAGTVAIKAKVRGYDLTTLHPGVALNPSQPAGIIGGIDIDFHQIQPICRDVRLLVRSNGSAQNSSFPPGARVRVMVRETGQSAEGISANGWAEVMIPQVPAGWPLRFFAINLDAGYFSGELGPVTIPEDGGTAYTDSITLRE